MQTKRTCSQFKKKMGAKRPKSLVYKVALKNICGAEYYYITMCVPSSYSRENGAEIRN